MTVRRIMKTFCGARWRKLDKRDSKVFTSEYSTERITMAKILLSLHRCGLDFVYIDEYSTNADCGKQYGWVTQHQPKYL